MIEVEYLIDSHGQKKAVVIPISLWRQIMPIGNGAKEELSEGMEDYCLGKAMDEAKKSPLLNKNDALDHLKQ